MFLNMRKTHARILDVKCQGAARYHAFSQQRRLPVLSDLFVVWSGVHVSCTSHQLDRSRSPKMHYIHLLVHNLLESLIGERERANLVVQLARLYPALMYAVMFYVILNKRKRLGDCVTFFSRETLCSA